MNCNVPTEYKARALTILVIRLGVVLLLRIFSDWRSLATRNPAAQEFAGALFVPWQDIAATPKPKLIQKGMVFRLGQDPRVPLWLETGLAERLRESARQDRPADDASSAGREESNGRGYS